MRQVALIERELREVANAQLLRELEAGTLLLTLYTCRAQMARCSAVQPVQPEQVARVLGLAPAGS